MKFSVTQSKKTISLCYGFGGALLLTAALGGFVLGDEMPTKPSVQKSDLVASGDAAASQQAQLALTVARERLMKQDGLTDVARRVRLTALDDSTDAYVSMMDRLSHIKERDPNLESAEAKTLLNSAAAIVGRLEAQETLAANESDGLEIAVKGVALLGLLSLFAGIAQTLPLSRGILRPFKAIAAMVAARTAS
jgi:hypothetical protein